MMRKETTLPKIKIDTSIFSDLDAALKKEWLVTNGLGGYASSTILGVNTRKYHGLLVAAFNPPVDRRVLLTKLEEEVEIGDRTYSFGANETEWGMQPEGYRYLSEFFLSPLPTFTYIAEEGFKLKKTLFMPYRKNATLIFYEAFNISDDDAVVRVKPFVNSRHFQTTTERNVTWKFSQKPFGKSVTIQPTTRLSSLTLLSTEGQYKAEPGEWIQTYFRVDASRGETSTDNNFRPGFFEFEIAPSETRKFSIIAVAGKSEDEAENQLSSMYKGPDSLEALYNAELKRRSDILSNFRTRYLDVQSKDWLEWLVLATDAFIVSREFVKSKSVIAGYHWFEDWGRDSLIALPGLTLVTGRFEDARQILTTFKEYCREGLIPNRFPDTEGDKPAYNTVDASLWYLNAVFQYLKYTDDFEFIRKSLWEELESIVEHHVNGTAFNIHMDRDGLICHGPQLTWMDAVVEDEPVTPREGKAVEIQALWYNALRIMQLLATRFGQDGKKDRYSSIADKVKKNFLEKFWHPQRSYLSDVVTKDGRDDSLRPNQIIAISLDFTMTDENMSERIVETVWRRLWGVYGLKTLPNDDPRYTGKYRGDWAQRDRAYHNGTVWPWLLGPFVSAYLKVKNYEAEARDFAFRSFLQPLFDEGISKAGLGMIGEIFDGDPPHGPNGCIAQAWSVAEPLRAYIEDVLLKRPTYEQQVLNPMS